MRAASPILFFLLLAAVSPPRTLEPSEAQGLVDVISARVEAIRGLKFERPVPVKVVSHAAAHEYVIRRLGRFASKEQIAVQERAHAILGLLPPGTSMLDEYAKAVEEAAAGFYDPERKEFFLLDDLPAGAGAILAAHELTHALEDQYYDIDARLERAREDDDLGFAVMAVHEGSASLLMAVYVFRGLREGWIEQKELESVAASEAVQNDKMATLRTFLRRPLLGAYVLGSRFLVRGRIEGLGSEGYPMEDVNRCYRDGPASSEQILHPEKFWDPSRRDDPRPVVLPDGEALLGDGWKCAGEGTLGELLLGPLVGAPTPETWTQEAIRGEGWSNEAASGWDGDLWGLWTRGKEAVVLLETVWDTAEDARQFASALPASLVWKREGDQVAVIAGDLKRVNARRVLRGMLRLSGSATTPGSSRCGRSGELHRGC